MNLLIYLIFFFLIKIIFAKLIFKFTDRLDTSHIYSTLFSILTLLILNNSTIHLNLIDLILLILNIIVLSYIFITVPGGYASSLRLFILSKFKKKRKIKINYLKKIINDQILFQDRFKRFKKYNLIIKKNNNFVLISKKMILLIEFINLNRKIFRYLKKN